jgi:hypothetical protein
MKCPHCDSERVYHSRAKSPGDRTLKRLIPVTFYRCHDCGWRDLRVKGGVKAISLHFLSLLGYVGGTALILAIVVGVVVLTLTFLGIPMPWNK